MKEVVGLFSNAPGKNLLKLTLPDLLVTRLEKFQNEQLENILGRTGYEAWD